VFTHTKDIKPIELKVSTGPKGRFYVTPDGAKYPSITTVLGSGEKPWLVEWRNSLGHVKADKETKRTADRGTAVHLMAEHHLQNNPNPTNDQQDSHISEFKKIKVFLKKIDNIVCQEIALYSDTLQVAGRVDCIAEYDGVLSVIDFKTSTNSKNDTMVEDYFLQTSAYAVMFQEQYGIEINQVVIIMSVEKGLPMVFKRSVDDYLAPLCKRINTYYTNKRVNK
jgi:genome maintenance exonuclease 1